MHRMPVKFAVHAVGARDHAPVRARRVRVRERRGRKLAGSRRGEPRGARVSGTRTRTRTPRVPDRERVLHHGRRHERDRRRRHRHGGHASVRDGRRPRVPAGWRFDAPRGGYRVRVVTAVGGPSVRAVTPRPPRLPSRRVELVVPPRAVARGADARARPPRLRAPLLTLAPRHLEHLRRRERLARGLVRVQALVAAQAVRVDDAVVRAEADQPPREVVVAVRERVVQRGLPRVRLLVQNLTRRRIDGVVGAFQHELRGFALVVLRGDVQ